MPDFVKSGRQHVQQESPDKLVGVQGQHFLAVIVAAVFISESDLAVGDAEEAAVADGDSVGVPSEVFEHLFGAAHWCLCINHPPGFIQIFEQGFECAGFGKRRRAPVVFQAAGLSHLLEGSKELAPEQG